jgi:hypothetical protein
MRQLPGVEALGIVSPVVEAAYRILAARVLSDAPDRGARHRAPDPRFVAAAGGHPASMDVESLARGLAMNRISFGAGLVLAPSLYGRTWIGSGAKDARTQVLARALGARDLVLGAGGLQALRSGDRERARRWFAAQGVADAIDVVATLLGGRDVPLPARAFATAMAAGSTAIAAAYVARAGS